jgi:hypothetical protein
MVSLEVMSPHALECFKTDRAKALLDQRPCDCDAGKTMLIVDVMRIHPATGAKVRGIASFCAWRRPGGSKTDFVCGALAPGDPSAHPDRTGRSLQDRPTLRVIA